MRYTMAHWGIYEVVGNADPPRLAPFRADPDPSPIGLHQLSAQVMATRVRRPAIRRSWLEKGPGAATDARGREAFVEVDWETAIGRVAEEIERVRGRFGNEAIFGGSYGWASAGRFHHAQSQVHRFLNTVGGYVRHKDSYSLGAARVLMPHIVAGMNELIAEHHSWDVLAEHTRLFVCFGGVPSKNAQISPGGAARHRVRDGLAALARAGAHVINVSPVADNLDTGWPVEWIACRPNTDTALMLGLAWVLRQENLHDRRFLDSHCVGYPIFERYLLGEEDGVGKTPAWAEGICGVPRARIESLAREMASGRTMINVAWSLQRAHHGEQPFWMAVTLAAMLGQIGLPGGGFGTYGPANTMGTPHESLGGPTLPQGVNPVDAFIPVARIADMLLHPGETFAYNGGRHRYPDIRLVYWAGGNPFHHHQDLNRLRLAWQRPETIVVHEQFWTATARHADVVLPVTTSMEREDIGYAAGEGVLVSMARIIEPVGESLDDFEIFTRLAASLGVEQVFTEGRDSRQWLVHLYDQTRREYLERHGIVLPDYAGFRERGVLDFGYRSRSHVMFSAFRGDPLASPLATPSGRIELHSRLIASFDLPDCGGHASWHEPREWLGAPLAARFPLHLLTDQPRSRLHSQLDSSPHSAAAKRDGREPVYLHPDDARARGITDGDPVEVFNERGICVASALLSDRIMPGVARIATGAWYDPEEGTGRDKHGNPNVLTADLGASSLSQGCAAQSCLVDVRMLRGSPPTVTAFTLPQLQAR